MQWPRLRMRLEKNVDNVLANDWTMANMQYYGRL